VQSAARIILAELQVSRLPARNKGKISVIPANVRKARGPPHEGFFFLSRFEGHMWSIAKTGSWGGGGEGGGLVLQRTLICSENKRGALPSWVWDMCCWGVFLWFIEVCFYSLAWSFCVIFVS